MRRSRRRSRRSGRTRYWCAALALAGILGCSPGAGEPSPPAVIKTDVRRFWEVHDRARERFAAEDFAGAAALYREALELNPRHTGSLYNLAFCGFRLGRHTAALAAIRASDEIDPQETKPKLLAAVILADPRPEGPFDLGAARANLDRAIEMNREESGPFLLQGRTAFLAADAPLAVERLELAARANPLSAEALNLLGALALRRGDLPPAASLFARAVKAARGAPPPAGVPGEGDTAGAGAGHHRMQILQGQWLLSLSGHAGGSATAESVQGGGEPPSRPAADSVPLVDGDIQPLSGAAPRAGRAIAAADFDGDGVREIAMGSLSGPLAIHGIRGGRFELLGTVPVTGISHLAAGDLDGDGRPDLYAITGGDLGAGVPRILLSRGAARFDEAAAPGAMRRGLGAIVLDGGDVLEVGGAEPHGAIRSIGHGPGGWSLEEVPTPHDATCATSIVRVGGPAGIPPEAVVAFAHEPPVLFRRVAEGWKAAPTAGLEALAGAEHLAAIDLDGDGWTDLAAAVGSRPIESLAWLVEGRAPAAGPLRCLRRAALDRWEPADLELPAFAARVRALATCDVDRNGLEDLLLLGGGPEPWSLEPWWLLLRRREKGVVLRRGPRVPGILSAAAAIGVEGPGGAPVIVFAGGGILPGDTGPSFALGTLEP